MKPSIPKGTRDFSPMEMAKRNYIFKVIRNVFRRYGFQPIETPALETLSTLMGKYGEEGDKLLFRVLNSGDCFADLSDEELLSRNSTKLGSRLCEKGLRYDLTVPFARYVVMHRDALVFPFKRFQMQPVWRADRPQKGRYREFYQCDADVVGSNSLLYEAEMVQMMDDAFREFGIRVTIKINNRKLLSGIAEVVGAADHIIDITIAIDKLDKIGIDKVNDEMRSRGVSDDAIVRLQPLLDLKGDNSDKLTALKSILAASENGLRGIAELEEVFGYLHGVPLTAAVELDLTLARGLNYYTGAILEVKANDVAIGSISGGGRYDNLTGIFGLKGVSGVGFSFGADRIYDVLEQLQLFPDNAAVGTQVLFTAFDHAGITYALPLLREVRNRGIAAEIYPEPVKIKKQMAYANAGHVPFVVIIGDEEINHNALTVKNMQTGVQQTVPSVDALIDFMAQSSLCSNDSCH